MIEDMTLAGMAAEIQRAYLRTVRQLAAYYQRSPDRISEEEVRSYLVGLLDKGSARGTFKIALSGIKFFFVKTLNVDWDIFKKDDSAFPSKSGCRRLFPMNMFAVC
jgi:hypothetical protein